MEAFGIRREERWPALIVTLLSIVLNTLFVMRLNPLFQQPGLGPYKQVLEHEYHLAGYDPYTYWCVSDWDYYYNVVRHPLLAWMMWPMHQLNSLLETVLGVNCVQFLMAILLTACTVYSFLLLYRILKETVGVSRADALLLSAWFYSFAYIMLSVIVPDHFTLSMTLLLLTLYLAGRAIKGMRQPSSWQWALLFIVTAGITLSNGVKVLLADLFASGRRFFRWRHLLGVAVLTPVLLWGVAQWQYHTIALPRQESRQAEEQRKAALEEERIAHLPAELQAKERNRQARRQRVLQRQAEKTGEPIEKEGLLRWTDMTTDRWQSAYENMFGESILFHKEHFLEDTLVHRPVFVPYSHWWAYAVEAVVFALFLIGIWVGRKDRFLWLCLSMFAFDAFLHLILGFGINEVHIMAPHWLFVVPVATAFALRSRQRVLLWVLRSVVALLIVVLTVCNSYLLVSLLLSPIKTTL